MILWFHWVSGISISSVVRHRCCRYCSECAHLGGSFHWYLPWSESVRLQCCHNSRRLRTTESSWENKSWLFILMSTPFLWRLMRWTIQLSMWLLVGIFLVNFAPEYIYVICWLGGRPRAVLKTEGTVFPNTDRPRPANNVFIFFLPKSTL